MGKNIEDADTEMQEYVCDYLCRFPREIYDQEQLEEICGNCKMGQYASKIRKGNSMKKYIGIKLIEAVPMTRGEYNTYRGWTLPSDENPVDAGYLVKYQDSYISWTPNEVFEKAYLPMDDNKNLPSGVSIGQKMVDDFISYVEVRTMGDRTTVVRCVLKNGYEIVESSSCVDPENYSEEDGRNICMKKIKDKIWMLLGFLLQTAWHGLS